MPEVYNLLDFLKPGTWAFRDGFTGGTLDGWEVGEDPSRGIVIKTYKPVYMSKDNYNSVFRPYPYLEPENPQQGSFDISSIASPGDEYRLRVSGSVTKHPEVTAVECSDVYIEASEFIDLGDRWGFESEWQDWTTRIWSPEELDMFVNFRLRGPSVGALYISGVEAEVKIEIEISPPPMPEPINISGSWAYRTVLSSDSSCEYNVPVTSADIKRIHAKGFANEFNDYEYGNCTELGLIFGEEPVWETDIDPTTAEWSTEYDELSVRILDFQVPSTAYTYIVQLFFEGTVTTSLGRHSVNFQGYYYMPSW